MDQPMGVEGNQTLTSLPLSYPIVCSSCSPAVLCYSVDLLLVGNGLPQHVALQVARISRVTPVLLRSNAAEHLGLAVAPRVPNLERRLLQVASLGRLGHVAGERLYAKGGGMSNPATEPTPRTSPPTTPTTHYTSCSPCRPPPTLPSPPLPSPPSPTSLIPSPNPYPPFHTLPSHRPMPCIHLSVGCLGRCLIRDERVLPT